MICLMSAGLSSASDWTRFRGPNGTGISSDRGLPEEIDPAKAAWSVKVAKGNSSPIVVDGRLFLTAHEGDQRIVLCYNSSTGEELWRRSIPKTRSETFNPLNGPSTPTPATDGRSIFVFFPEIGLIAYTLDGKELWRTPMGPFTSIQGLASSPIYVNGRILLLIDTPQSAYLAAYAADTGKESWRVERPIGVLGSYSTPTLYERKGTPTQVVVAGAVELTGYEADTGKRLWWVHGVTVFPTAPPLVAADSVYTTESTEQGWPPFAKVLAQFDKNKDGKVAVTEAESDSIWARSLIGIDQNAGDGDGIVTAEEYSKVSGPLNGGGLTSTRVDGSGDVSKSHVNWRFIKGMPSLAGALLYQGVLYVVRSGIVTTFDPASGKLLRQERLMDAVGDYYASPVAGDGKIYLASLDGKVTVLKAGTDWKVLSTADLDEQLIATPAIADSRIYIRTAGKLLCFAAKNP